MQSIFNRKTIIQYYLTVINCFLRWVLELRNKWFISRFICGVAKALRHRSFPKILVAVCQNLVGVQSKLHEYYIYHTSKIFKTKMYIFWSISIYTFFIVSTFHWETTVPNIPYNLHSFSILQCIPKYSCTQCMEHEYLCYLA